MALAMRAPGVPERASGPLKMWPGSATLAAKERSTSANVCVERRLYHASAAFVASDARRRPENAA